MLALLLSGCTQIGPSPTPPSASFDPSQQTLYVISKGAPTVSVRINGVESAVVPCNGGASLEPGDQGLPELPWSLHVIDQTSGRAMLEERVTELPRWLLVQRDSAGLSSSAISGPFVPCGQP